MSISCLNRVVNSARSARLHTGRMKVNPAKTRKKDGDTSAVATLKDARELGCVFQDTEPLESLPILQVLGSIRRVRFTKAAQRHANIREKQRSVARTKFKSKFLISAVRTLRNWTVGLRKRLKDRSDVPAETRGEWPRNIL